MQIDGVATRTCVLPVSSAVGKNITTIEGLQSPQARAVQAAWVELQVPQCGYCQSGMVMAAAALLKAHPRPTDAQIDEAMTHLCRCATYHRIREAIHAAASQQ